MGFRVTCSGLYVKILNLYTYFLILGNNSSLTNIILLSFSVKSFGYCEEFVKIEKGYGI